MEMKISQKTEKPLLSRTEMQGTISFEASTPSRLEVRKKISEALKVDESLVMVKEIATSFGEKSAKVTAHVYKTKEDAAKFEPKTVKNRHLSKEEKAKLKEAKKPQAEGGAK